MIGLQNQYFSFICCFDLKTKLNWNGDLCKDENGTSFVRRTALITRLTSHLRFFSLMHQFQQTDNTNRLHFAQITDCQILHPQRLTRRKNKMRLLSSVRFRHTIQPTSISSCLHKAKRLRINFLS